MIFPKLYHAVNITVLLFTHLFFVGQRGEELSRVLRATRWFERLGQTGALLAGSWDVLLPKPSAWNRWITTKSDTMTSLLSSHDGLFHLFLQGGSCELKGKQDAQDFQLLIRCFETIGLHADQISTVWAVLSSILQLGNMCFSSYEVCVSGKEGEKETFPVLLTSVPPSNPFRVSHLRWLAFSVRPRLAGWDVCYRFPLRRCRLSSPTESQSVLVNDQCSFCCPSHLNTKTTVRQMISSLHRRPSMTGYTAPCLLKVPLNPGKKRIFFVFQLVFRLSSFL